MRALMPFIGSRGDVQPGLALARAWRDRGHELVLGVPPNLVGFAAAHGLEAVPMGPDSAALLDSDLVRRRIRQPHPVRRFGALRELAGYGWTGLADELEAYAPGCDVVVTGLLAQEVARAVADRHPMGQAALHYCPVRRNAAVPLLPGVAGAGVRRRAASWRVAEAGWRTLSRPGEDAVRGRLGVGRSRSGLPHRMSQAGALELQAYDPVLFPELAQEWGARRPWVGQLGLLGTPSRPDRPPIPAELDRWLDAGPPPVYWGFGSMPVPDPAATLALIRSVSRRLGVRSLVAAGWGLTSLEAATAEPDEQLTVVDAVDHATVLPRCAAAVHHGGAGTTHASLRAGIGTLVCWFSADQPIWGQALERVGAGASVRFAGLDEAALTAALRRVLDPSVAAAARATGQQMVDPGDAARDAAEWVERVALQHAVRQPRA